MSPVLHHNLIHHSSTQNQSDLNSAVVFCNQANISIKFKTQNRNSALSPRKSDAKRSIQTSGVIWSSKVRIPKPSIMFYALK